MFPMRPDHRLELNVENFGPIAKASIQLRPLTVLVGPSNTGKSYFATLMYSLQRVLGVGPRTHLGYRGPGLVLGHSIARERIDTIAIKATRWVDEIRPRHHFGRFPAKASIPPDLVRDICVLIETQEGRSLQFELEDNFAVEEVRDLVRHKHRGHATIELLSWQDPTSDGEPCRFQYHCAGPRRSSLVASVPVPTDLSLTPLDVKVLGDTRAWGSSEDDGERRRRVLEKLAGLAQARMLGPLQNSVHYLPSGRTGLMHALYAVLGSLLDRDGRGHPATESFGSLSGTSREFLGAMLRFGSSHGRSAPRVRSSHPTGVVRQRELIERKVLEGRVDWAESPHRSGHVRYRQEGGAGSIALVRASAMVSELAPLVLYLGHVSPGDTLVIEEPESHLHPAAQVSLMEGLVGLVKCGVRVVITTHSEWMLECLANRVGLAEPPERERGLSEDDVGAWLFERRTRPAGTVVQEVPLDRESGTYAAGYDDVARALYNEWADRRSDR